MGVDYRRTSDHYERVKELMEKAGQIVRSVPTIPEPHERVLRAKLILEEAIETCEALGLRVYAGPEPLEMENLRFDDVVIPNLVEIVDGCADIIVVTTGTLVSCGVADSELLRLVDTNNLAKFGPGGYRREDGKWVKPPGHQPPDIQGLLEKQHLP